MRFTTPDFFFKFYHQRWTIMGTIPFNLSNRRKEEWISVPAGCREVFGNLAYNRMKSSDFWQGYNPCPSPSLPWQQLLHTPVTLPFLRNVLVPFHVYLVHLQNKLKPHPAPYLFFLGCWPSKGWPRCRWSRAISMLTNDEEAQADWLIRGCQKGWVMVGLRLPSPQGGH